MKRICLIGVLALAVSGTLWGGVKSEAVKEGAEYIMRKFGREAAKEFGEEATQVVAKRIETLAVKYGDEVVLDAAKKVGPRMFRLVEEVGEGGAARALKLMARQGDEAVWVVARPRSFALFAKYGENAADALIRHREVAETLIENYGPPMTRALNAVGGQNGRRLAMLADEGVLGKLPQREGILDAIARHGDRAADWVWRNKGAITVAAVATAFVKDPQPFIAGTVEVVDIGGEKIIRPVAEAAAKSVNWNLVAGVPLAATTVLVAAWALLRARRTARGAARDSMPQADQSIAMAQGEEKSTDSSQSTPHS